MPNSEDLSGTSLRSQHFGEPTLQFPFSNNLDFKQESAEVEADDSTDTVIRSETNLEFQNSSPNDHQNFPPCHISIKTESLERDNTSKTLKNADVSLNGVPSIFSPPLEPLEPNFLRDSQESKRQKNSTTISVSEHIQKIIKKKLISANSLATTINSAPISSSHVEVISSGLKTMKNESVLSERNESSPHAVITSPKIDGNSNMCFSIDNRHPSSLKYVPKLKSSLCDPSRKFSTDCSKYLLLNIDFKFEDIKECISNLSAKYLSGVNLQQITAPSNYSEYTSKYLSGTTTRHDKSILPSEQTQEKFPKASKSQKEAYTKFVNTESTSVSLSTEKLSEILKFAIFSNPLHSHGSSTVDNDSQAFSPEDRSPLQVQAAGSQKRETCEEIDVQNLMGKIAFIESKKLKFAPFSENICRKKDPLLLETARSKNTEFAGFQEVNHRNSSDYKEPPTKKIKIADYRNKRYKLRTQTSTFMEQDVEGIRKPSTSSPLAFCYSSSVLTPDRVRPSTSSVCDSFKQNGEQNQEACEEIDVRNLKGKIAFTESEKLKSAPFSESVYRKKDPPLLDTARSKTTEFARFQEVNYRNSSEAKKTPAKKIKIADYRNKCYKLRTQPSTFMEQTFEGLRKPSTSSPLAFCYSSSVLTPDRVCPSTPSVCDSFKQNGEQNQEACEEIDVQNLKGKTAFTESEKLKFAPFSESVYRKKDPPLLDTARSKTTEFARLQEENHRNSSEAKKPPAKKIKIADYRNKRYKLRTQPSTFMVQNVEGIRKTSSCSLSASCYSSSILSPDRVRPSTSSFPDISKQNSEQNQKPTENIYSQSDAIPRDPRLPRNVPYTAASVMSPAPQLVTAGMVSSAMSSSKEVVTNVKLRSIPKDNSEDGLVCQTIGYVVLPRAGLKDFSRTPNGRN